MMRNVMSRTCLIRPFPMIAMNQKKTMWIRYKQAEGREERSECFDVLRSTRRLKHRIERSLTCGAFDRVVII